MSTLEDVVREERLTREWLWSLTATAPLHEGWYTETMLEAPKQNWRLHEEKCRSEHQTWVRSLTPSQALDLCEAGK
jgi:hypothetical protein